MKNIYATIVHEFPSETLVITLSHNFINQTPVFVSIPKLAAEPASEYIGRVTKSALVIAENLANKKGYHVAGTRSILFR